MNLAKQCLTACVAIAILAISIMAQAEDKLRIALIPAEDSRAMLKQSRQLLDALEQRLGYEVEGFVATDYNGVIEALRAKHVDVAYLGPFSYVKAAEFANVEAFVVAQTEKNGGVDYHSQIIVRADSDIQNVDDLKGRNFAFVEPTSASGYIFPMLGLLGVGITPQDFSNVIYTGAHDANILAVKNKRVDAATVADRILVAAVASGHIGADEYRVIWRSVSIPESPMVWRKDLDEEQKQKIKQAFLQLSSMEFGDQGMVTRYVETNDKAYDIVREAGKLVRK